MTCALSATQIQTYVDGELTGVDLTTFEAHLWDCKDCSDAARLHARFKAAVRGHLAPIKTPDGLEARIKGALAGERKAPGQRRFQTATRVAPLLAAAGILVFVFADGSKHVSRVLQQAVLTHTQGLPLDVRTTDCDKIANWFNGRVAFQVRAPAVAAQARCEGGRLVNVGPNFAALVRYQIANGRKLSLMVMDDDEESDELTSLPRKRMGDQDVYVGQNHGTSNVAYKGADGLWYVWTSDEGPDRLKNVVQQAVHER